MTDNTIEQDNIGEWAESVPRNSQNPEYYVYQGVEALVTLAGENSRDHGFHDDWPTEVAGIKVSQRELGLWITEKLALIHEEISEALGEIRSGHEPGHVYYRMPNKSVSESQIRRTWDGAPEGKPEGFGVELADAVIRIADLAYLTGIDLPELILEKHEFNATRPYKHGRKF